MSAAPPRRIVIAGHGIAGVTAAHALRDAGFHGDLTIVGDEPYAAYSRPALSKAVLHAGPDTAGQDGPSAHLLPPSTHGATELLGVTVQGLDRVGRRVRLDDGETLPYDRLVIATGARARRLSASPDELTLRGLDDALLLRKRLAARPAVLVVGGGPLGMEIASGCLAAGCQVTLVSQGRPLLAHLGEHLAALVRAAAIERGLRVVETEQPARLDEAGGAVRVVLGDGAVLEADLVLSAVGDVPNTEWLHGTGLVGDGLLRVDERGMVTPEIAAVGDLAAVPTPYGRRRLPLWSSAIEQAKVAAVALIRGAEAPSLAYQPYFWTEQFGMHLKAVGHLPLSGSPEYVEGGPGGPALMRWPGAVVSVNHRIAIPRMRRLIDGVVTA